MQRSIRIYLEPSPAQVQQLAETRRQFTAVFNAVCAHGWRERLSNGVKLHHATYYPRKADYPNLVSDLHVQARVGYPLGADRSGQGRACTAKSGTQGLSALLRCLPAAL